MAKGIGQSLAGRVGMGTLLPLSFVEACSARDISPEEYVLQGGYPRLYDVNIPLATYFESYLATYVQRDVADYLDVRNLTAFRAFLGLCAGRVGSLLNVSSLASDAGVSYKTAHAWLSMLEASYVVYCLAPYTANLGKRLTKSPKIYFCDTGLLCHLLGIRSVGELVRSPMFGSIFENLVVADRLKRHLNHGEVPELFFYRDDSKIEVDLCDMTDHSAPELIEVKSSATYHHDYARHLGKVGELLGIPSEMRSVVLRVDKSYVSQGVKVRSIIDELSQ